VHRLPAVLALSVTCALPLAACGNSSSGGSSTPSAAAPGSSAPAAAGGTSSSSSSAAANVVGSVTMNDGKPQGGVKRITIKARQPAVLLVTSNKPAQVHVHGADRLISVPPNKPTPVDVSEPASGSYEVEDHDSDSLLVQLRVS
jgi:hypothetical protein